MTPFEFKEKLKRLESQLAEAMLLRKEFDDFKCQVQNHAAISKKIISDYLSACRSQYEADIRQIQKDKQFCTQIFKTDRSLLEHGFQEQSQGFPTLAQAFAEYLSLRDDQIALHLQRKSHPALKAADVVKEMKSERRTLAEKCKVLEYMLLYYEELFPFLADYREIDNIEQISDERVEGADDPVKNWLSAEEYDRLPRVQKFQLALDRYWKRRKTSWRLGRDYERYIGYLYEKQGYEVSYVGIIKGREDCGRDLICKKNDKIMIVQCKYWSRDKMIHEKHINQLFGTCVEYWIDQCEGHKSSQMEFFPDILKKNQVIPCFTTSTVLSDTAKHFASALGVIVEENFPFKPYPSIKCNVSRRTGERIYHLPFDQQYDKTLVEEERNEGYVNTVAEAESQGFRRAFKWQGKDHEVEISGQSF